MLTQNNLKYALVLSGGGFNGAFQLGALNCLDEHWKEITGSDQPMHFDIIAGVSVGSLNGSLLAIDKLDQLNRLWDDVAEKGVEEIYTSDFINTSSPANKLDFDINFEKIQKLLFPFFKPDLNFFKLIFKRKQFIEDNIKKLLAEVEKNLPRFNCIASNKPLEKKLDKLLDKEKVKSNFLCGFVSLDDGNYYSVSFKKFKTNKDFVQGVLASTAIPIVWQPVPVIRFNHKNIKNSVDGGVRNVSPLGDVIREIKKTDDDYVIFIINCSAGKVFPADYSVANVGTIALRSLHDIAITEIFNNDVDHFLQINELVRTFNRVSNAPNDGIRLANTKTFKEFKTVLIQPEKEENPDMWDSLVANRNVIPYRKDHGFKKAEMALNKIKKSKEFKTETEITI